MTAWKWTVNSLVILCAGLFCPIFPVTWFSLFSCTCESLLKLKLYIFIEFYIVWTHHCMLSHLILPPSSSAEPRCMSQSSSLSERRVFFYCCYDPCHQILFLKSFCTQCRARLKEGRLWVNTIPGATLHTPRYQVWVCVHSSTHHALKHKVFSLMYKALVVYFTCPALYRVVQWSDKAYCTLHLPEKKE